MRKNISKLAALCLALCLLLCFSACGAEAAPEESPEPTAQESPAAAQEPQEQEKEEPQEEEEEIRPLDMEKALFIGDSRTVGLSEYAGLPSDFFCDAGMSVYNIFENYSDVGGRGFTQLKPLLEANSYETVFLMLGINEIGMEFEEVMVKFGELIDYLLQAQPDAEIIIMKNLHVTSEYSDGHPYITNPNLDRINEAMAEYADGERIFVIDINPLYDDENGGLSAQYTSDGVHFYAKHYMEWGRWIAQAGAEALA